MASRSPGEIVSSIYVSFWINKLSSRCLITIQSVPPSLGGIAIVHKDTDIRKTKAIFCLM